MERATSGTAQIVFAAMADARADRFVDELLLPPLGRALDAPAEPSAVALALGDPWHCLNAIYGCYAFSRRGKERHDLAESARLALRRLYDRDNFGQFLQMERADHVWQAFDELCAEKGRKSCPQLNEGPVAGLGRLAQQVYAEGFGSIAAWIGQSVVRDGRLEDVFNRIVDVRGVGPKLASTLLRDVIHLFGLEEEVEPVDRLYLLPIDKWLRQIAPLVVDEPQVEEMADWVLAGKLTKYSRRAGVSPIRFSMGVTFFGMRELKPHERIEQAARQVVRSAAQLR